MQQQWIRLEIVFSVIYVPMLTLMWADKGILLLFVNVQNFKMNYIYKGQKAALLYHPKNINS